MSRPVAILRPEPGNRRSCERAAALGLTPLSLPLFEVGALAWTPPDPAAHDGLVLTSANALRWGGAGIATLTALPVFAVGGATAGAAVAHGFTVRWTGESNAAALLDAAEAMGLRRALHLGGRETTIDPRVVIGRSIAVYASDPCDTAPEQVATLAGSIAVLHSARAARRLAQLVDEHGVARDRVTIAAFAPAVAAAAGPGWGGMIIAASPDDAVMFGQIAALAGAGD